MVAKKSSRAKPGTGIKALETKNKSLTKDNDDLKKDIVKLKKDFADLKSELKNKTIEYETLHIENSQYKDSITVTNKEITVIQKDFKGQLDKLQTEIDDLKMQKAGLEIKLNDSNKKVPVKYTWEMIEHLSKMKQNTIADEKMVGLMNQFVKAILFWFDHEIKDDINDIVKALSVNILFPIVLDMNQIMESKP